MSSRIFIVALGVVAIAAVGQASTAKDSTLATRSASGHRANAVAIGKAPPGRFEHVSLRVTAHPNQKIDGGWTLVCRAGGSFGRDSQNVMRSTPFTVPIRTREMRSWDGPDFHGVVCTIVGEAKLRRSGYVHVQILGR
jgi:hypothetical protein